MKRLLLNLVTALSLLLCVASCALWVWTASTMHWVGYATRHDAETRQARHVLGSGGGALSYQCVLAPPPPRPGARWFPEGVRTGSISVSGNELADQAGRVGVRFLGFGYYHFVIDDSGYSGHPQGMTFVGAYVPHGFLVAVFVAGPAARVTLRLVRRRGRKAAGLCPRCGYDLRATPGRCPECGTAAPVSTTG